MSWKRNYLTGLVFFPAQVSPGGDVRPSMVIKYRCIKKENVEKFETFVRDQFLQAKYINYYELETKQFLKRKYL